MDWITSLGGAAPLLAAIVALYAQNKLLQRRLDEWKDKYIAKLEAQNERITNVERKADVVEQHAMLVSGSSRPPSPDGSTAQKNG